MKTDRVTFYNDRWFPRPTELAIMFLLRESPDSLRLGCIRVYSNLVQPTWLLSASSMISRYNATVPEVP